MTFRKTVITSMKHKPEKVMTIKISNSISRVNTMHPDDKLWELYIHALAGYYGNIGANDKTCRRIAEDSLTAAQMALKVWEGR